MNDILSGTHIQVSTYDTSTHCWRRAVVNSGNGHLCHQNFSIYLFTYLNLVYNLLPQEHFESPVFVDLAQQSHISILGLYWSTWTDYFTYNLNLTPKPLTERHALSLRASIYDPCGFLTSCIMLTYYFMQLLCING